MNPREIHIKSEFARGYACAVATVILMEGDVNTQTRELFSAGLGKYDLKQFRKWGIDEHDISIFKKFRKELKRV